MASATAETRTNVVEEQLRSYEKFSRIHLETTNHCNLQCEHCYVESSHKESHHSLNDLRFALEQARHGGAKKVTLTGGEFLTHPEWKAIVEESLKFAENLYFITNGLLLSAEKLKWLARQKVVTSLKHFRRSFVNRRPTEIGLAISLDGLCGNRLVRKNAAGIPVSAEQVLERIHMATKYGIRVTVNTTVTNAMTAKELPRMFDILSSLDIDRWQIDQAYLAGRLNASALRDDSLSWLDDCKPGYEYIVRNYLKDYPNIPKWRLEIVQVFRYDSLHVGFSPASSMNEHPCSYNMGSLVVERGNLVRFCPSLRDGGIGRITPNTPASNAINESSNFREFLSHSINDLPCRECRYWRLFHGGCRANSLAYMGKMWSRDPICCSLAPFVENSIVPLLPPTAREAFASAICADLPYRGM